MLLTFVLEQNSVISFLGIREQNLYYSTIICDYNICKMPFQRIIFEKFSWRTYVSELSLPMTLNEYTPTIFFLFLGGGGVQASRLLLGVPNLILQSLK